MSLPQSTAQCRAAEIAIDCGDPCREPAGDPVYAELWISLASLLRSYTAVHGLSGNRMAEIVAGESSIVAQHGKKQLKLWRNGALVNWMRENGDSGRLELTLHGRLRSTGKNQLREEEMDMAAEAWARELMQEFER